MPVFDFVLLNGYPAVVVTQFGIVGKYERLRTVLQVDNAVRIVGSRIHHMPEYLADIAVLAVAFQADGVVVELLQAGRTAPLTVKARPRWPLEELKDWNKGMS